MSNPLTMTNFLPIFVHTDTKKNNEAKEIASISAFDDWNLN